METDFASTPASRSVLFNSDGERPRRFVLAVIVQSYHPPLEGGSTICEANFGEGQAPSHDPSPKNSALRLNFSTLPQGEGRVSTSRIRRGSCRVRRKRPRANRCRWSACRAWTCP